MRESKTTGGIGFCGALTILFIALKLTGVINWSWVFVLMPIWIPVGIILIMFLLLGIVKYLERKFF